MDNVFGHVTDIIANELDTDPDKITPETSLTEDLGANELDLASLFAAIEDFFGCQIPIDQQEQMQTVQELVNYLYGSPVYL
jgi:acyl carrier protein